MPLLWLIGLQAAAAWSPPAQAAWTGEAPPVEVTLQVGKLSMSQIAPIEVDLVARTDSFAVSPFLQATRGIAFEVTSVDGKPMHAREPMITSPPPPPLEAGRLVRVAGASPFRVVTRESARTMFPGPGTYVMKAVLFLTDWPASPTRRARLESAAVTVHVTK
jgi:hypothetical protein